jgi:hypothetical protein
MITLSVITLSGLHCFHKQKDGLLTHRHTTQIPPTVFFEKHLSDQSDNTCLTTYFHRFSHFQFFQKNKFSLKYFVLS